jgi:hypothetical protein
VDRATYLDVLKYTTMMNSIRCSSSFGCHVADGDVAPGFHFREMSGGREVNLP